MLKFFKENALTFALIIAIAGLLGSLYFSEVMGLTPCLLCWYQRIALYPMVVILVMGIARRDAHVWAYALPLSIIGTLIAAYHVLVTYGIFHEAASCALGVSCAAVTWSLFGFITIPFLSVIAFITISVLLFFSKQKS